MSERDIALIDDLRGRSGENAWLEFKKDNVDQKMIAKRISALSNAARVLEQDFAYMVWGIEDADHAVIGTAFDPDTKTVGNTVLSLWLSQQLNPTPAFTFRTVNHPDGRVVLLEIPAASIAPVCFDSIAYIRIGSATPKLSDHPEQFQRLIDNIRPFSWEKGIARSFIEADEVLKLLDYPSYFRLTKQNLPDNRLGIFERLAAEQLITSDHGGRWNITNLGGDSFCK